MRGFLATTSDAREEWHPCPLQGSRTRLNLPAQHRTQLRMPALSSLRNCQKSLKAFLTRNVMVLERTSNAGNRWIHFTCPE